MADRAGGKRSAPWRRPNDRCGAAFLLLVLIMINAEAPARETLLTPAPLAFVGEQLSPAPFHFRFTGEDALELASYNSQSGVRVAVQGRMWDPVEGIRPFAFTHVPNTDRTRALERFGLARGYLLNLVVFAAGGSPRWPQTFISLHVTRGEGQARVLLATLLQGYVTAEQELGFPGSPLQSSIESGGLIRNVTGTNPAAATEIIETVPTGARWQVLAFKCRLTTDATAATRKPIFYTTTSGGTLFASPSPFTLGASSSAEFYWAPGAFFDTAIGGNFGIAGLPDPLIVLAGDGLGTSTQGFQAGDNYDAPLVVVREWLEAQ